MRCWGDTTDFYNLFKNMGKSDACTATGYQAKEKTMESDWNQTVSKEKTLTHSLTPTTAWRTPSLSSTLCMNVEPPDNWWDAPHQLTVKYLNRILNTQKCKHVFHCVWKILHFEYRQLLFNSPHLLLFPCRKKHSISNMAGTSSLATVRSKKNNCDNPFDLSAMKRKTDIYINEYDLVDRLLVFNCLESQ